MMKSICVLLQYTVAVNSLCLNQVRFFFGDLIILNQCALKLQLAVDNIW